MVTLALPEHLVRALAQAPPRSLCVAFSGGPDSSALLHALAGLPQARRGGLRAAHVDHALHPDSARWADHARAFCAALDVPCTVLRVTVDLAAGHGVEAAAREARYTALAGNLAPGERLITAHHRDDQAETMLLKLLRGAGPAGLGGMRERRPLGAGELWRPLLELPRAALRTYVQNHALACLDDPANADPRLGRNQLRSEILPRLAAHWPTAVDAITHSATLCRAAADTLREQWLSAFDTLHDPHSDSLDAAGWRALAPALREPLLDHWLHARQLPAPGHAQRTQIERQLDAREGRVPCIRWPGAELHVWKGRLWALPPPVAIDPYWQVPWRGDPLVLPDGGRLTLNGTLDASLSVRLRRGGERLKPAGDRHTRELRDLFQQAALPPWQRATCPMIHEDDVLIAAGDRWLTERGKALLGAPGERLRWRPGRGARSLERGARSEE